MRIKRMMLGIVALFLFGLGMAEAQDLGAGGQGVPVQLSALLAEDAVQEFQTLQREVEYFSEEAPGTERLKKETLRH